MSFRRRFRQRLIRWLGGISEDRAEQQQLSNSPSLEGSGDGQLVLPAQDAARQAVLAGKYYAHAEELIRRGAAELSAPFYRQAYVMLHASQGKHTETGAFDPAGAEPILNTVIDLGSPQPQSRQPEAPSLQSPQEPIPAPVAPPDAEQSIRTLQSQLNAETVDAVAREAVRLRAQGIRHPELDHLQGVIHVLKGESEAAAESFRMAIAQAPGQYRSLVNLAGLLVGQGRLEEAQALLQKALEQVNPDSDLAVPALTNLSLVHQAAGRSMEEALLVLRIHRLKPGHLRQERLLRAAGTLQEMAEEPAAIELLQWLSDHNGGEEVWRPLATLLERRGDYQAAAQVYRLLLQPRQAEELLPTP
jgi:tetratricopeptide (TPR) repeat protein